MTPITALVEAASRTFAADCLDGFYGHRSG